MRMASVKFFCTGPRLWSVFVRQEYGNSATFVDIQKPFQTDKVSLQDRIVTPDDRERLHHDDGTAFGGALLELVAGIHESLVFCCTILPLASTRRVQSTYSSHWPLSSKQRDWLTSATLTIFEPGKMVTIMLWCPPIWGPSIFRNQLRSKMKSNDLGQAVDALKATTLKVKAGNSPPSVWTTIMMSLVCLLSEEKHLFIIN